MSGIAGIASTGRRKEVSRMLDKLAHRGPAGRQIVDVEGATLGVVWSQRQAAAATATRKGVVGDEAPTSRTARAEVRGASLVLTRDPLGVAPLYYGKTGDGLLCFASEVKALLPLTTDVHELPPGSRLHNGRLETYFRLEPSPEIKAGPEDIARELRRRLEQAVARPLSGDTVGSWLSGGLDSSVMAALARPLVSRLHTFVAGLPGAPDVVAARTVADHLKTEHHEVMADQAALQAVLPRVIYHLESFDALLVRSSLTNYLVAAEAARYVPAVLSGEAADECFAGYAYLADVSQRDLPGELLELLAALHNTALQRVDRCSAAHGTLAFVPFTDPEVVDYALAIPIEYKRRDGIEKWILRHALDDSLPEPILWRKKAKFWEGAGVGDIMAGYAERKISDADYRRERVLPNGWLLRTKEELLYYRVFREQFGDLDELAWVGRTKGAPVQVV